MSRRHRIRNSAIGTSIESLWIWRLLLLLVSAAPLLPLLVRAREVGELPNRIAELVERRLTRLGIASGMIEAEYLAMSPVATRATRDRSILGIMVDFAKAVPYHLEPAYSDDTSLALVEDRLAETPCYPGRSLNQVVFQEEGP